MKFIPLAYAMLWSLCSFSAVTQAAVQKPASLKKPNVVAPLAKSAEPMPICGMVAGKSISIPMEYAYGGAIYDADQPGVGCAQSMVIAGIYLNLQDLTPATSMDVAGAHVTYLIIGAIGRPYQLGARKAIDNDIIQRSMAKESHQEMFESTISRKIGKLNDGHYWSHEYSYIRDESGMTPYKICKTYREGEPPEVCEYLFKDEHLGLAFRVGFEPSVVLDYNAVRAQALVAIERLMQKS